MDKIHRLATGLHLYPKNLENLKVLIPPLPEQQKIAEILSGVDEGIEKVEEVIKRTERLKKGLMNELLTKGINHKEFKNSPLGKIPKEWEVKKISDLFLVETGTTPSTKVNEYWENGTINWITPADMSKLGNNINLTIGQRKITEKALKECNLTLMPKDSIVISTRAPVGYVGIVAEETTFNQGCKGLIPKEKNIDSRFYCYYLLKQKQFLQNISGGSTFKELSKDLLQNLLVPYLPLNEQQKIAEILSGVDEKLELERRRRERLERIKRGLMEELLTGRRRVHPVREE